MANMTSEGLGVIAVIEPEALGTYFPQWKILTACCIISLLFVVYGTVTILTFKTSTILNTVNIFEDTRVKKEMMKFHSVNLSWKGTSGRKSKNVRSAASIGMKASNKNSSGSIFRKRGSVAHILFSVKSATDEASMLQRIHRDAHALLARTSPSEELSGQMKTDSLIGWFNLYFDIPATIIMPFMMRGVWPQKLRIPFHTVGSVLYFGTGVSLRFLRVFAVYFSIFILFLLEVCGYASILNQNTGLSHKKLDRFSSILSRLFYGAMYQVVMYQSGTLLGEYKSCEKRTLFSDGVCRAVSFSPAWTNATNWKNKTDEVEYIRIEEASFSFHTIIVTIVVALWAFRGSIMYTLYEKNSTDSAFIYDPVYDSLRYTIKTSITIASSFAKNYRFVTMPVCTIGFATLFVLTYRYQPCQGQGRTANNLRATGFATGLWISLCGFVCAVIDANSLVDTPLSVAISYIIVAGGMLPVATIAWTLNDLKARQYTIPDMPWHKLLSEENAEYTRKVAADAYLMHAEQSTVKDAKGLRMLLQILKKAIAGESVIFDEESRFIKIRLCAAYIIYSSEADSKDSALSRTMSMVEQADLMKQLDAVTTSTCTSCLPSILKKKKKVIPMWMNTFKTKRRRVKSAGRQASRGQRMDEGDYFKRCITEVIMALTSPTVSSETQSRVSVAIIAAASMQAESASKSERLRNYFLDPEPNYYHALLRGHVFFVAKCVRAGNLMETADAILNSLYWIATFMDRIQRISDEVKAGNPWTPFLSYFITDCEGEHVIRSDVILPLLTLCHMVILTLYLIELKWAEKFKFSVLDFGKHGLRRAKSHASRQLSFPDTLSGDRRNSITGEVAPRKRSSGINWKNSKYEGTTPKEETGKTSVNDICFKIRRRVLSIMLSIVNMEAGGLKKSLDMGLPIQVEWEDALRACARLVFSIDYRVRNAARSLFWKLKFEKGLVMADLMHCGEEFDVTWQLVEKHERKIARYISALAGKDNLKITKELRRGKSRYDSQDHMSHSSDEALDTMGVYKDDSAFSMTTNVGISESPAVKAKKGLLH